MSEETRIVEEEVGKEPAAEAEVSQPEAQIESAEEAVAEVTLSSQPEVVAAIDEVSAEAAPVAPSAEAESDGDDEDAETAAYTDADGKHVVYLSVGQEVTGTVKRTTEFGAFVDIGAGRDGLIHISELAVGRIGKVGDVLKEGQQITAWIKKLDRKRNRISLTLIAPGTKTLKDLKDGDILEGTVSKIMPYGAFVDIGVGTDALLHIREMSNGYVAKPEDVVKVGEKLEARIISVDRRRRRIDLSLKGLRDEPEPEPEPTPVAAKAEPESAEPVAADSFADVEVLSPMELAFKRAMEAEGIELNVKKGGKKGNKRNKKGNRSLQEEIISRTLESMRD
ncbi:MAG: S1 RNA-binding domain-containing protein [Caldilineaceae bacterium]|nr:S1 RNA-binding domain-containing protein [Caldilineaceae bacterium]